MSDERSVGPNMTSENTKLFAECEVDIEITIKEQKTNTSTASMKAPVDPSGREAG